MTARSQGPDPRVVDMLLVVGIHPLGLAGLEEESVESPTSPPLLVGRLYLPLLLADGLILPFCHGGATTRDGFSPLMYLAG